MNNNRSLRAIPSVEKVLQALGAPGLPRPALVAVVRRELAALRAAGKAPDFAAVIARVRSAIEDLRRARIRPVINGTGILVHTNLGRAPLGDAQVETLRSIAGSYNNLEYDLSGGERGSRAAYLEHNLAILCGAEAAIVVNNCAAALVLILRHFTRHKPEVVISRGELIQIGGGFRIPEILEASGAKLREVGTTNQTTLKDYAAAIGPATAMLLKVHRSNFYVGGFVASPPTEEVVALAHQKRLVLVEDLGSGAMIETSHFTGLEHEPTPGEVLSRGVDLVCFSGDKLCGGPQAGIIAGKQRLVRALKREPFYRALRCDKLILSVLETTVDSYLEMRVDTTLGAGNLSRKGGSDAIGDSRRSPRTSIPVLDMLRVTTDELRYRAEKIKLALGGVGVAVRVGEGKGQIGGGALPRSVIASVTLDLAPEKEGLAAFAARLRSGEPPVIGYISGGWFKIDLRTVFPRQDEEITRALRAALVP